MPYRRVFIAAFAAFTVQSCFAEESSLLRVDHYVRVRSKVPAITGQMTTIYTREVVRAEVALRARDLADRVVLFVHGAGTPTEVAFDVPYQDYSWMGYLARAGLDVFGMDMTGYGRALRPGPMTDPCNLSAAQQAQFIPQLIAAPWAATQPLQGTPLSPD